MSKRLRRDKARARLTYLLKIAKSAKFFQMIWCADRLRVGDVERGRRGLPDVTREVIESVLYRRKLYFQPWILEDLINEWLSTPRSSLALPRELNCESYQGFATIYNAIIQVDDAEAGFELERGLDVLQMMPRLGHRQFEWQRGWLNGPALYRSAFIYGQGESRDWYRESYGIDPTEAMMFAMAAYSAFNSAPEVGRSRFLVPAIGLNQPLVDAGLRLMTASLSGAVAEATRLRRGPHNIAAKPSVLRRTPMIEFASSSFRAPLPDLLLERVTSGLYLDFVRAPDSVRTAIARRFEQYCVDLLQVVFGEDARPAFQYGSKKKPIDSPDIRIGCEGRISLVVECKFTRMTFEARFSDAWQEATDRGYRELAKGVCQIWRYAAHLRMGRVAEKPADSLKGLVLTMDPWMRMTHGQDEKIFKLAREWCAANDPEVALEDQCAVGFTHVGDLEELLHSTAASQALAALRDVAERAGWGANELSRGSGATSVSRPFIFGDRMPEVIPWLSRLSDLGARAQPGQSVVEGG